MGKMLTQAAVKKILDYDAKTGTFRWRTRSDVRNEWNTKFAGQIAGATMTIGYRMISIWNIRYYEHRLAWLYMTGKWPSHQIDHINGQRGDNRFCNLRLATSRQNKCNRAANSGTRSGVKNVHWHAFSGLWHVRVMWHKREYSFGYFHTIEGAAEAARKARQQLHGDYAAAVKFAG